MMRTRSLKKVNSTSSVLFMVILLLAFVIVFGINSKQVNAESTYTVTGQYVTENFGNYTDNWSPGITSVPSQLKTTFSLYKVGHYEHDADGKSVIILDPPFDTVTLPENWQKIKKEDYDDENDWIKEWLAVAQTLSMKVEGLTPVKDPVTVTGANTFSFEGITEKGLYLLYGTSSELKDVPKEGQNTWWRPQPMLIQVFDGSKTTVKVKPECETLHKFRVTKYWKCTDPEDIEIEGKLRPASVTVKIYYDKDKNPTPVYTEKLNKDNSWSFAWSADREHNDPFKWTVEEQILSGEAALYYTYSVEPITAGSVNDGTSEEDNDEPTDEDISNTGNLKIFKLTNTFEPAKLKIIKKIDKYLNNSDNVSTTFIFEVTGYKKNAEGVEKRVYHKYVGLEFNADGKLINEKEVGYLPVGLSRLVVREVESPNYDIDEAEKQYVKGETNSDDFTFDGKLYTVSFKNTYNNETHFDGGVINHFNLDGDGFKPGTPEGKTHNN